jgi:hypothetical protein
MCKLQHSYYNRCDHGVCRILSVCRNRNLPNSKCRDSTNLYFPGYCGSCFQTKRENETLYVQKPRDRVVTSCTPPETPDFRSEEPISQVRRLATPYTSPTSPSDAQFPVKDAQDKDPLHELDLTDRFPNAPLSSAETPTSSRDSYAALAHPSRASTRTISPTTAEHPQIDVSALDSGYSSVYSSPAPCSAGSFSDPESDQHALVRPNSAALRSRLNGHKQAGCVVKKQKSPFDDEPVVLELERCRFGTYRVLDQLGDLQSERVCGWHSLHWGWEERGRACGVLMEDGIWAV